MNRGESFRHLMRVIAGAYLAYLGYKILRGGVLGGEMTGGSKILGIVFSILFIGIGVGLAVIALRNMGRARELEREQQENEEDIVDEAPAEPVPEEAPAEKSLFMRAHIAASGGAQEAEAEEDAGGTGEKDLS